MRETAIETKKFNDYYINVLAQCAFQFITLIATNLLEEPLDLYYYVIIWTAYYVNHTFTPLGNRNDCCSIFLFDFAIQFQAELKLSTIFSDTFSDWIVKIIYRNFQMFLSITKNDFVFSFKFLMIFIILFPLRFLL